MGNKINIVLLLPVLAFYMFADGFSQNLQFPRESQQASVSQRIGLTDIIINYHRPAVKDRKIWGGVVPYNEVWRAGANDNTTITFTHDIKINGSDLPAGNYGLHMIPNENEWTIIFNKNFTSWGSFFYDEKEDALRISVKPVSSEFHEWLTYSFESVEPNSTVIALNWEKFKIPFKVEADVQNIVLSGFRRDLKHLAGFSWEAFYQAGSYSLMRDIVTDETLSWSNRALQMNSNFRTMHLQAALLEKKGEKDSAAKLMEEASKIAAESDWNTLGYQYLFANKTEEAIEIFKKNVELYPDSWNAYDSLAEAYEKIGDKKSAAEYYSKALALVQNENQKSRITRTLENLKN